MTKDARIAAFRNLVWEHYRAYGRHDLPWRKTRNPYRILVSEVMLQQTQVDRVVPFYREFLKSFPTAKALAAAPLADVLRAWQGLGYNRRAKLLQEAARFVLAKGFPKTASAMEELPGVGPYTARAVAAFAYDADGIFLETNVRAALIHHFFPGKRKVSDEELMALLSRIHPAGRAREWYSALMDYGSFLKRQGIRTNARVKGYAKQKTFQGSSRQARGAILRALASGPVKTEKLLPMLGEHRTDQVKAALSSLLKDGMIALRAGRFSLPGHARQ